MTFRALPADLIAVVGVPPALPAMACAPAVLGAASAQDAAVSPVVADFGSFLDLVGNLLEPGEKVAISGTSLLVEMPETTAPPEFPLPPALAPAWVLSAPLPSSSPLTSSSTVRRVKSAIELAQLDEQLAPADQGAHPLVSTADLAGVPAPAQVPLPPTMPPSEPEIQASTTVDARPPEATETRHARSVEASVRRGTPAPTAFVADIAADHASSIPVMDKPVPPEIPTSRETVPSQEPLAHSRGRHDIVPRLLELRETDTAASPPADRAAEDEARPRSRTATARAAPPRSPDDPEDRVSAEPVQLPRSANSPPSSSQPNAAPAETQPPPQRSRGESPRVHEVHSLSPEVAQTAPQGRPVREVVIQVGGAEGERVEVQITERAGAVRVHVRTHDVELTAALRANLGELVRSITDKGLRIETWTPADTWPLEAPLQAMTAVPAAAEAAFNANHKQPEGEQYRNHQQQESRTESSTREDTDQHRRGRAREQWFDEFERRLDRS